MANIQERHTKDGKVTFRVQVRIKGAPPALATFQRKTDAREWAVRTEAAIREGRYFKTRESQRKTLSDLIERYIKNEIPKRRTCHKKFTAQLRWWQHELGYLTLQELTPARLAEVRDKLLRSPLERNRHYGKPADKLQTKSPATVVHYMAVLSHALTIGVKEWGWLDDNPMLKVRKPKVASGRTRFLDDDERQRLLEQCRLSNSPYLYTLVILALSTGGRRGELTSLTWQDIDLERGVLRFEKTKNSEARAVPLMGKAHELLTELKRTRRRLDCQYIFPRADGKAPIDMNKHWLIALENACISNFTFHDLRHSAASYLAMNGATLIEIAAVLGHKTLQMVKRYSHLTDQHTMNVVQRMNERFLG